MNNNHEQQQRIVPILDLDRVEVISPLGRGAKGVVFLVKEKQSGESWALKVILRELVEKKHKETKDGSEYKRIYFEQQVLSRLNHPLLPRLRGVLATDKIVGYAIDYCPGRDLNWLRKQQTEKMFSVDIIRFYAAELVLALEYLHNLGIAYRDLKPENIMVQENGHIMLVDFDLSTKLSPKSRETSPIQSPSVSKPNPESRNKKNKRFSPVHRFCSSGISPEDSSEMGPKPEVNRSDLKDDHSGEKSNSFVGTEEYVAPEIIQGYGHDIAVDWWSLGVLLYEMLYGVTPFKGTNRKETFFRILTRTPDLVGETTPLRDLIAKLLVKDAKQRIRVEEIKGHDFFKGIDWDFVLEISRPPYVPSQMSENGEEGTEGIKRIDVELFVQGIFAGDEKNKVDDDDDKKKNNSGYHEENRHSIDKGLWVKGLNNHQYETNNFVVF